MALNRHRASRKIQFNIFFIILIDYSPQNCYGENKSKFFLCAFFVEVRRETESKLNVCCVLFILEKFCWHKKC